MTGAYQKQTQDRTTNTVEEAITVEPAVSKKAAGAFRTISEVADELDVQQHVLRFWETKFSQVKPLKRGGGRRYYRPEDVALLKRIHTLLYTEGYTIKGVQKLLKTQGKAQMIAEGTPAFDPAMKSRPAPANETAPRVAPVTAAPADTSATMPMISGAPELSDKQRLILQAMLGDLRDLRNMIGGDK